MFLVQPHSFSWWPVSWELRSLRMDISLWSALCLNWLTLPPSHTFMPYISTVMLHMVSLIEVCFFFVFFFKHTFLLLLNLLCLKSLLFVWRTMFEMCAFCLMYCGMLILRKKKVCVCVCSTQHVYIVPSALLTIFSVCDDMLAYNNVWIT